MNANPNHHGFGTVFKDQLSLKTILHYDALTLIKEACKPLPNEGHVGDFPQTETALLEKILQCPA